MVALWGNFALVLQEGYRENLWVIRPLFGLLYLPQWKRSAPCDLSIDCHCGFSFYAARGDAAKRYFSPPAIQQQEMMPPACF
jgi:hypothetical protein